MTKKIANIVKEAVRKIVDGYHPDKIILFGSAANETSKEVNDLDFLIVKQSNLRRDLRDEEIRKLLFKVVFPMDIFVYTPEEYEQYKNLPGSFMGKIAKTGKVLYESN